MSIRAIGRTSQLADLHVPIRAGTDVAFLGGMIRHVIETESYFKEYVVNYTNASTLVCDAFRDTEELEGLFSGFDAADGQLRPGHAGATRTARSVFRPASQEHATQAFSEHTGAGMDLGSVRHDDTLQDPRCVFQVLRRHFSRYTPEMVERICGISREQFMAVADALIANSGRERTSMFCYANGWTQHSEAVQMIRSAAILQLLLGQCRAGPAAGSWRCAGTRRSRGRPTSRPCMTCCPATCTCRGLARVT